MSPLIYYGLTLAFFFFTYTILCQGLNLQFGMAGILNFAYIAFVAVGAYITGVTSLGQPQVGSGQTYILGAHVPFPFNMLLGGLAACLLAVPLGLVAFRRSRSDYLAMLMISASIVLYDVVNNYIPLFDGADGLNSVPAPFTDALGLDANSFIPVFAGFTLLLALALWLVMSRITRSPLGRTLRAIRDDPDVAQALGKNVFRYQMTALLVGSFYAGIGGALLIEFSSAFNPSAWLPPETFLLFAALIVGGLANNLGALVGALIVPVIFVQLPRFLPDIAGRPGFIDHIDAMLIGILLLVVLWFRPEGLVPERRQRFDRLSAVGALGPGALLARLRRGSSGGGPKSPGRGAHR